MQNRRLLFAVIIKLLSFLGLLLLAVVLINSLFMSDESIRTSPNNQVPLVMLDFSELQKGQIKKTRWNNREVAILLRQFPEKIAEQSKADLKENLHPSIKLQTRSQRLEYFVYFNMGDSRNCPLYYAGGVFKDVCSSNRFNEAGISISASTQGYSLEIPPHYFNQSKVIFGKW